MSQYNPAPVKAPYEPLRLCVYATVALLAWIFGAWAVVAFAVLGVFGYVRARRSGLLKTQCLLRDTRLVIGYMGIVAAIGVVAIVHSFRPLF